MFARITDKITTFVLIILGLISVTISTLDIFVTGFDAIPVLKETSQITLLLIGILCLAIGLERLTKFEDIHRKLDELSNRLKWVAPAQVLDGHDAIYNAAMELVNDARKVIRASSFRERHRTAPVPYLHLLASKIEKSKKQKQPIEYRLLYGYGSLAELVQTDEQHKSFFESRGIGDHFRYKYLNTSIGIDLLIVDNKNILFALPTLTTDPELRKGIRFVGSPDLVEDICSWYDNYLWSKASTSISS